MYKCKCGGNVEELGEIPDYENPCKCKSIAISDLHTKVSELEQSLKESNRKLEEMREGLKSMIGECSPYELRDTFLKVKIQKLLKKEE